jgi:hypothetical protein
MIFITQRCILGDGANAFGGSGRRQLVAHRPLLVNIFLLRLVGHHDAHKDFYADV